jgi:hypothetical protein
MLANNIEFNGVKLFKKIDRANSQLKYSSIIIENVDIPKTYNELTFTFALDFDHIVDFGNIFTIFNKSERLFALLFSDEPEEKRGFYFNSNNNSLVDYFLLKDDDIASKTVQFEIRFISDSTYISIGNYLIKSGLKIEFKETVNIIFGATPIGFDVTNSVLRNFIITHNSNGIREKYEWKFNKFQNNISFDESNEYPAKMVFAYPAVNDHYFFSEIGTTELVQYQGAALDPTRGLFYLVDKNCLLAYSILMGESKKYPFVNPLPFKRGYILYNKINDKLLYTYPGGGGKVAEFDFNSQQWDNIDTTKFSDEYYEGAVFINPIDSSLYLFGGYGLYTFKNRLQKYNSETKAWENVLTIGDTIDPRRPNWSNIVEDSLIFLGGGSVSSKGDQREEVKELSDLYRMNLRTKEVKMIGEMIPLKYNQFIRSNFVYREEENSIYFLLYTKTDTLITAQIHKYEISSNQVYPVGQKLEIGSLEYFAVLHFSENTNEIILLLSDGITDGKQKVKILKANHPLITQDEFSQYFYKNDSFKKYYILLFGASLVIVISFINVKRKKKRKTTIHLKEIKKNSISLLDTFGIYDNEGKYIVSEFSTKILEAFLLILINSIKIGYNKDAHGISTSELTNKLWGDFDKEDQKNNRNVTINKIRTLISKVEGANIFYAKSNWKFTHGESIFIDICEFTKILEEKDLEKLLGFLTNNNIGPFCKNISFDWLDPIKVTVDNLLITKIIKIVEKENESLNDEIIYMLGKSILKIDDISQNGIALVLNSLKKQNNLSQLRKEYEIFIKNYYDVVGEKFTISIEDLTEQLSNELLNFKVDK